MSGTAATRARTAGRTAGIAILLVLLAGCRPAERPGSPPESGSPLSVMVWHLDRFGLEDRDDDGQRNDLKPAAEQRALAGFIAQHQPDLLLVQDISAGPSWESLLSTLAEEGLVYPHTIGPGQVKGESDYRPAILSRYALQPADQPPAYRYTVSGQSLGPTHGILEAHLVVDGVPVTVLNVQLQDRVFHVLGQSEIRRSEGRLLGGRLRALLAEDPTARILAAGALNDRFDSGPLEYLTGPEDAALADLRPADEHGAAWTAHRQAEETWERTDYLLVSPSLRAACRPDSMRLAAPLHAPKGTSHRALLAEFVLH